MKKYCKYCYKKTEMDLVEGEYLECQECDHRPFKATKEEIENELED